MEANRVYNFNPGPATLPLSVLKEAQAEFLNFGDSGMSILEISHRAKPYAAVHAQAKADIKTSIEAKGVTVPPSALIDAYSGYVDQISAGDPRKDVNFYDYDGTLLYAYTKAEFLELSALPANPSHSGLTAQGWNWTLADAKTYVTANGKLEIGQLYITDDGKTRLYITLDNDTLNPTLTWYQSLNNGVTINWGDGSAEETVTGSTVSLSHTYASAGDYIITFNCTSGSWRMGGGNQYNNQILTNPTAQNYNYILKKVEFGNSVTIVNGYSFYLFTGLETVTFTSEITRIGTSSFGGNTNLKAIICNATTIDSSTFQGCASLKVVSLPQNVSSVGTSVFSYCSSLERVSWPSGVNLVPNSTFSYSGITEFISSNATEFGPSVFTGCTKLVASKTPNVTVMSSSVFQHCSSLKDLSFGAITSYGNYCFANCSSIKEIRVDSIPGTYHLQNCRTLTKLTIASGITTLQQFFANTCGSLKTVTIPSTVSSIGNSAFASCASLLEVHVLATTPPTLGTNVFQSVSSECKIYVPLASLSAYQSAWSTYSSYLVGE